uniref:WD_REPEATS_REGION domain-containing protein n=1 Tax=Macrostomum lignano TaxID=282301 RepID=A0A1I8JJ61_9PLAT
HQRQLLSIGNGDEKIRYLAWNVNLGAEHLLALGCRGGLVRVESVHGLERPAEPPTVNYSSDELEESDSEEADPNIDEQPPAANASPRSVASMAALTAVAEAAGNCAGLGEDSSAVAPVGSAAADGGVVALVNNPTASDGAAAVLGNNPTASDGAAAVLGSNPAAASVCGPSNQNACTKSTLGANAAAPTGVSTSRCDEAIAVALCNNSEDLVNDSIAGDDTADMADDTANMADNTADLANDTANMADDTADLANDTANMADDTADLANDTANMADDTADLANDTANMADDTADLANDTANMADDTADLANDTANMADDTADLANDTANMADDTADLANDTANMADDTAELADDTANMADDTADLANDTADMADSNAASAGRKPSEWKKSQPNHSKKRPSAKSMPKQSCLSESTKQHSENEGLLSKKLKSEVKADLTRTSNSSGQFTTDTNSSKQRETKSPRQADKKRPGAEKKVKFDLQSEARSARPSDAKKRLAADKDGAKRQSTSAKRAKENLPPTALKSNKNKTSQAGSAVMKEAESIIEIRWMDPNFERVKDFIDRARFISAPQVGHIQAARWPYATSDRAYPALVIKAPGFSVYKKAFAEAIDDFTTENVPSNVWKSKFKKAALAKVNRI